MGTEEPVGARELLARAAAEANRRLGLLKARHAGLKGFLVFAAGGEQVELGEGLERMLSQCPGLFVAGGARKEALALVAKLGRLRADKKPPRTEIDELVRELDEHFCALKVDPEATVELRLSDLNYELIWQLQESELLDSARTPQTKASIRLVMGLASDLAASAASERQ